MTNLIIPRWLESYEKSRLPGDLIAGLIVAIMLVPQAMAYAMLAGLPPETGLYASIFPLIIYALTGSSNFLAVGPVAIIALMVASATGELAEPGSMEYQFIALNLAVLAGLILILFGFLRFGLFANFLSHAVMTGFINAAALIIAVSQLKYLLGVDVANADLFFDKVSLILANLSEINPGTSAISIVALLILLIFKTSSSRILKRFELPETVISVISKTDGLAVVILGAAVVWLFGLHEAAGVLIVGYIPQRLPSLQLPVYDQALLAKLLPAATLIAFVTYLESISVARSLASKRRQRVKPNRELISLGLANLASALSGAFPVAGGVSRSSVNFSAGANTQLASIISALLVALTLLLFSPLFYYLPKAILAAIVILAVLRLIDMEPLRQTWRYNKADWLSMITTFIAVLVAGVEIGILCGFGISIALYLWRTANPHIAEVGRVGETEHYRNVLRNKVKTCDHVRAVRVDESLYFANTHALEDKLLALASEKEVNDIVLICSAINFIDSSALETLEITVARLHDAGVTLHLAEVKEQLMDKLERTSFLKQLTPGKIYLSTHEAMGDLNCI